MKVELPNLNYEINKYDKYKNNFISLESGNICLNLKTDLIYVFIFFKIIVAIFLFLAKMIMHMYKLAYHMFDTKYDKIGIYLERFHLHRHIHTWFKSDKQAAALHLSSTDGKTYEQSQDHLSPKSLSHAFYKETDETFVKLRFVHTW